MRNPWKKQADISKQHQEPNHYQIFVGILGILGRFPEHGGKRSA